MVGHPVEVSACLKFYTIKSEKMFPRRGSHSLLVHHLSKDVVYLKMHIVMKGSEEADACDFRKWVRGIGKDVKIFKLCRVQS